MFVWFNISWKIIEQSYINNAYENSGTHGNDKDDTGLKNM